MAANIEEAPDILPDNLIEAINEVCLASDFVEEEGFVRLLPNNDEVPFLCDVQPTEKVSDDADDEEKKKPGAPYHADSESDRIEICWNRPSAASDDFTYQVRYKESDGKKWRKLDTESQSTKATISNLRPNTGYIFKVRMVYDDDEGPYGPDSQVIKTSNSPAMSVKEESWLISEDTCSPRKYAPRFMENEIERSNEHGIRSFFIGDELQHMIEKTILLVGATGAGKSTLVDGMVNYIMGVTWEDSFRFHVKELDEGENLQRSTKDKTMSQTEFITSYTINPPRGSHVTYRLRIIDTPGFGDTRGIDQDKKLVDQIRHLFSRKEHGVQYLDAICFLAKAPDERLTKTQEYIFEQILLLFGKNTEKNICPLITFVDGREPQVLPALRKYLPCTTWFGFNNSALFAENRDRGGGDLSDFFWEMGKKSYKTFFTYVKNLEPQSLDQTHEVLMTRHKIEMTITELQKEVQIGIQKVGELEDEIKLFEQKESEYTNNKSFTYTVMETIEFKDEIRDGQSTTNCKYCKKTCHFPCTESQGDDKSKCTAMDWKGNCMQCRQRCSHLTHSNEKFKYSYVQVPVVRSRAEMEKKYKKAGEEIITHGEILARMYTELSVSEELIKNKMVTVTELNIKLMEIALKPNQVSLVGYIDLLIDQEKHSEKPGAHHRLKVLNDIKEKAEIHKKAGVFDEKLRCVKELAAATVQTLYKTK